MSKEELDGQVEKMEQKIMVNNKIELNEEMFCPKCGSRNIVLFAPGDDLIATEQGYICKQCGFKDKIFPVGGKK